MLLKDVTFQTPLENILYDEVLLQLAEEGSQQEALRFWESETYFVVLGRIAKIEDDVHEQLAAKDRIKILRRASGGGTVLQGPGCLNFSFILSRQDQEINDLKRSYRLILGRVVETLKRLGIDSAYFPISDIALSADQRKISGNAQKRARKFILHHGTLLVDFDLSLIGKYLKMPKETPEYRRNRGHLDFIANTGIERGAFKEILAEEFKATQRSQLCADEKRLLKELMRSKKVEVENGKDA